MELQWPCTGKAGSNVTRRGEEDWKRLMTEIRNPGFHSRRMPASRIAGTLKRNSILRFPGPAGTRTAPNRGQRLCRTERNRSFTGTSLRLKVGLAEMLKGGVIMDVMNVEQARIAEEAGATSVMALERVPAMIRAEGGVARMAKPSSCRIIALRRMADARLAIRESNR